MWKYGHAKGGSAGASADQFLRLVPAVIKGTAQRRLAAAEAAKLYASTKRRKGTMAADAVVCLANSEGGFFRRERLRHDAPALIQGIG